LPAIRTVAPSAQVLSVGDDGGDREALERRAEALGVRGAISFSGAWERAKLPAAYRSAAVCVVPSRFEAFPYVALEAMACGCAVVAAAVGGLPEAIEHGVSGLLVAAEDPEALAAAVAGLLSDPDRRLALGRAARARVLSLYTARKVAERMAEIYAETCEGKRR
jgi:glycosyltransferase involved in cell wall biosynthesis